LEIQDTYKTIAQPSEETLQRENSKFFGYAFPITSEDGKTHIEALKNNIPMQGTFVMPIK
jgi:putative IMPACT (imprinted ancient) family translation regulator